VLDIGCGDGWYAKLAARMQSRVVAFDIDSRSVADLYDDARSLGLAILPLVIDFAKPTAARGLANHWSVAASERFRCDLVLALGVVDQLVMRQRLNFDQIAGGFHQFTKKYLIVEFVSPDDMAVRPPPWYTVESLERALSIWFRTVKRMSSSTEDCMLLLCES
jgi:hypothetical protein